METVHLGNVISQRNQSVSSRQSNNVTGTLRTLPEGPIGTLEFSGHTAY